MLRSCVLDVPTLTFVLGKTPIRGWPDMYLGAPFALDPTESLPGRARPLGAVTKRRLGGRLHSASLAAAAAMALPRTSI